VQLSDLRGQVVLVNVWATWCPPCRAEMPMIEAAYARYRDQGFTVLAVNQREDAPTIAAYLQAGGYSFPALLDADGAVSGLYQALVLPSSYFIDRAGVVRAVYKGLLARSVIAGTVEQLLAEAP
jgi:thiol-disulfide isomerase/thioredoxin